MDKIFPKKYLGQNFLIDNEILNDIIQAAELEKDDIVLEIGAGAGVLTLALAKKAKKVIAVEKDKNLIPVLREKIKDFNNIEVVAEDIRQIDINNWKLETPHQKLRFGTGQVGNWKLIGNIPYYLTGWVIRNFLLEAEVLPEILILMVQKEVGERIAASKQKTSFLNIAADYIGFVQIVKFVPAAAFLPKPKVDSAIIKIKPDEKTPPLIEKKRFFAFLKAAFGQPRKTLVNNLSFGLKIPKEKVSEILSFGGLKGNIRPGELDLKSFLVIHNLLDEIK